MGLLSKILGKKNVEERQGEPDMVYIANEDERMNWAIEKAKLTLWYFEESLANRQPYQVYFSIKVHITDGDNSEHIWLVEPHFDDEGNLFGTVGNEPINVTTVKMNQKIGINRDLISDWMTIENGRLIGGYTIRAIRYGIPEIEKAAFDNSLGLYIDEGIDHFKTDLNTPEGAILSIEKAYNEKNLNAAITCKDFNEEAQIMLRSNNMSLEEDIVHEMGEVLKLSFVKNLEERGFPNFKKTQSAFEREKLDDNHYIITEICWFPDGRKSIQKLNTFKSSTGWKVLGPVN